jgi:hypothetical protein
MQLFFIRSVKAKMTLRKPFGQKDCEWVAVRSLKDQVFVVAVVKKHVLFHHNWVKFIDWFDADALCIWEMQKYLLIPLKSEGHLLYISYLIFDVKMHCTVEWLSRNIANILVKLNLNE